MLNSDNDISINSNGNSVIKGSILNSGQADIQGTNNLINGATTITSSNLDILAAVNSEINNHQKRTGTSFTNKYNTSNSVSNNYINSQLNAKSDNFTFNVSGNVNIKGENILTAETAYINALDSQLSSDLIAKENLLSEYLYYEDTTREMTEAGQAAVSIAAVAATVATAGAAGVAVAGSAAAASASTTAVLVSSAGVAAASTAASTAATTAISTGMNVDGDIFKQAKDIGKSTWDATTSKEAFESYAIAAGTAVLTAGLTQGLDSAVQHSAKAVNSGNASITQRAISTLSQNNIASAVAESAISNISSSAVQSAVNGDSFSEALENQVENTLIGAAGNLGAQKIGSEFKNGNISRAKQLTLHSALGCGTALAGGGDCATGAVSGVTGELAGEYFKDNLYPDQTTASLTEQQKTIIKELGGLAGGLSAIFTGNAVGLSESEIADNIFSGQRIGKNAVENNLLTSLIIGGGVVLTVKGEGNPIKGSKEVYEDVKFISNNVEELRYIKENYDLDLGIQGTILTPSINLGTNGIGFGIDANPNISLGLYANVVPKNESVVVSISKGFKNIASSTAIITNEGNLGFGVSAGAGVYAFPMPYNMTFHRSLNDFIEAKND